MIQIRFIRNKYGDNAEFLFTGTVSLMCKMGTESIYEDFYKDTEIFDLRKYSKDSKYYNKTSKLLAGKMKDDT